MSFDADEFDFEEEFEKHDLNKGVPSYIANTNRQNSLSSSSADGSNASAVVAVAVPITSETAAGTETGRPVSVRSESVDTSVGPAIPTPLPVAVVDSAETQTQTQTHMEPPPPAYEDPLPLPPPRAADTSSSPLGATDTDTDSGPMQYPASSCRSSSSRSRNVKTPSSSISRPPRPKWQQDYPCISTSAAFTALTVDASTRHEVLEKNERTFLEARFAGAPSPTPSQTMARLRDAEECHSYHEEACRAEIADALTLLRKYLACYREGNRAELYGDINTDREARFREVLTEAVGDYVRARAEEAARLETNGLAAFNWVKVDRGVERDCLGLLLSAEQAALAEAEAGQVGAVSMSSPDESAASQVRRCGALVAGYMEVVCALPYAWCGTQGRLLNDFGSTAVLLGRHPWRRAHAVLTLFLAFIAHEVHMEHCPGSLLEGALRHTAELTGRVWVQCWETLSEHRAQLGEAAAEAAVHCVFAQLDVRRAATVLQESSGAELRMVLPPASSEQRRRWASPSLLQIYNAHSIPQALRSSYLKRCDQAGADPLAATPSSTLVSEIVHDGYYPAVEETSRLALCRSPMEVLACCGALIRTVTALAPIVLGADELLPLVACVVHMGLFLGRAARVASAEQEQKKEQSLQYFSTYPGSASALLALLKATECFSPEHVLIREEAYALTVCLTALSTMQEMQ